VTIQQAKAIGATAKSLEASNMGLSIDITDVQRNMLLADHPDPFLLVFRLGALQKIDAIRSGLPAHLVGEMATVMAIPKDELVSWLGLSRVIVNRKAAKHQCLSRHESALVIGMQSLIGQVQSMVIASEGRGGFDAARWVARWLGEPLPALGGKTPASYMDTVEGQKYISSLLAVFESGSYM